jgi:hypothetical protein
VIANKVASAVPICVSSRGNRGVSSYGRSIGGGDGAAAMKVQVWGMVC